MDHREVVVEGRAGSFAAATGARSATSVQGQLEISTWKSIIADCVAREQDVTVRLVFFGAANQIAGYRLYYMLRHAKKSGVRTLTLHSDGLFWIEEATDWLLDSGVDHLLLSPAVDRRMALVQRIAELDAKKRARRMTQPIADFVGPHDMNLRPTFSRVTINWRAEVSTP